MKLHYLFVLAVVVCLKDGVSANKNSPSASLPTAVPTMVPSMSPSTEPTMTPSTSPSSEPSVSPSVDDKDVLPGPTLLPAVSPSLVSSSTTLPTVSILPGPTLLPAVSPSSVSSSTTLPTVSIETMSNAVDDLADAGNSQGTPNHVYYYFASGMVLLVVGAILCCFTIQRRKRYGEAMQNGSYLIKNNDDNVSSNIFVHLQAFDENNVQLSKSPTGGWNVTYKNQLAFGIMSPRKTGMFGRTSINGRPEIQIETDGTFEEEGEFKLCEVDLLDDADDADEGSAGSLPIMV